MDYVKVEPFLIYPFMSHNCLPRNRPREGLALSLFVLGCWWLFVFNQVFVGGSYAIIYTLHHYQNLKKFPKSCHQLHVPITYSFKTFL